MIYAYPYGNAIIYACPYWDVLQEFEWILEQQNHLWDDWTKNNSDDWTQFKEVRFQARDL